LKFELAPNIAIENIGYYINAFVFARSILMVISNMKLTKKMEVKRRQRRGRMEVMPLNLVNN